MSSTRLAGILAGVVALVALVGGGIWLGLTLSSQPPPTQATVAPTAPSGSTILGVFEGRSPCGDVGRELNSAMNADCQRIKWQLTLYQQANTQTPTTYVLTNVYVGMGNERFVSEGTWDITQGTKSDPDAVVYRLELDKSPGSLSFMKADDNILLLLEQDLSLMVGDASWSYTLSRTD
jgi:hypothetical protein